jgi:hypothetical protein
LDRFASSGITRPGGELTAEALRSADEDDTQHRQRD